MEVGETRRCPSSKEILAAITRSHTMKNATDRTESCGPRKENKQGILEGEWNALSKWMGLEWTRRAKKNDNRNQIHAQRAHFFPPASAGSDSFNGIN